MILVPKVKRGFPKLDVKIVPKSKMQERKRKFPFGFSFETVMLKTRNFCGRICKIA